MQIAGTPCRICVEPIVLASEGKRCASCDYTVHLECQPAELCPFCSKPLLREERPARDRFSDAYDPRESRSGRAVGPLLMLLAAGLFFLLMIYLIRLA